jgi:uncharacterized protein (UPF0276 family)
VRSVVTHKVTSVVCKKVSIHQGLQAAASGQLPNQGLSAITTKCHGFGLGLRPNHYLDFLNSKQPVEWLEIISDNFLVEGGKPLVMLDSLRATYPMAMHGVALSIGSAAGVDMAYIRQIKQLANRIEPLWISDHLCWTGHDHHQLHDLNPLPYTEEAARLVIEQIGRVQEVLQRRLVVENVSSYIQFQQSTASEWQFLNYVAQEADCLLLLDVNNIHVSSVNHGFDAQTYLSALPAHRIQQIHLAGHSRDGEQVIDTHDHPVAPEVWALYAQACALFGDVATMIERDAHIPPLAELLNELEKARSIATHVPKSSNQTQFEKAQSPANESLKTSAVHNHTYLNDTQKTWTEYILHDALLYSAQTLDAKTKNAMALVNGETDDQKQQRLGVYHHAYRTRLCEVLADTFAKTYLFMGSDAFDTQAVQFVQKHPPTSTSLNRYGQQWPEFLAHLYPNNVELKELAQLDWDLRVCFDGPNHPAFNLEAAQKDSAHRWLHATAVLHTSVVLRTLHSNATQIWKAIDADQNVPEVSMHAAPRLLMVWRRALQPHFQVITPAAEPLIQSLAHGASIHTACLSMEEKNQHPPAETLSLWLHNWLKDGIFLSKDEAS